MNSGLFVWIFVLDINWLATLLTCHFNLNLTELLSVENGECRKKGEKTLEHSRLCGKEGLLDVIIKCFVQKA